MNLDKFFGLLTDNIKTESGIYYVVEHTFDGETWLDSYLANSENEAIKLAEFNHCDKLPNILLTVKGLEQ